jgi:hypothetical protein
VGDNAGEDMGDSTGDAVSEVTGEVVGEGVGVVWELKRLVMDMSITTWCLCASELPRMEVSTSWLRPGAGSTHQSFLLSRAVNRLQVLGGLWYVGGCALSVGVTKITSQDMVVVHNPRIHI